MIKEVFNEIKAKRRSEERAAEFVARFDEIEQSQVRAEAFLAKTAIMTYRDVGLELEGEIGAQHGLKSDIMAGVYSEDIVHAVATRAICRGIAKAQLKRIHEQHRQRRQSGI